MLCWTLEFLEIQLLNGLVVMFLEMPTVCMIITCWKVEPNVIVAELTNNLCPWYLLGITDPGRTSHCWSRVSRKWLEWIASLLRPHYLSPAPECVVSSTSSYRACTFPVWQYWFSLCLLVSIACCSRVASHVCSTAQLLIILMKGMYRSVSVKPCGCQYAVSNPGGGWI